MEKDLKVFDIGNHVWCGELTVGYDEHSQPVVEKFYGLSEESVRAKVWEHSMSQRYKKKKAALANGAAEEHAAPAALAVNGGSGKTPEPFSGDAPDRGKVIPIRGEGEITYVVDGEPPEDELAEDDMMLMSGRVADVIILKYAETRFDTVNNRPTGIKTSNLKPDWEERLQSELAEGLPGGDMTVTELCEKWIDEKARQGALEKEIYRKKNVCAFYILPVMGDALCRDVDRRHAERAAIRMLYRKDNSDKYGKRNFMSSSTTAKLKLAILNDLLEYGWSSGCIPFRLHAQVNIREV